MFLIFNIANKSKISSLDIQSISEILKLKKKSNESFL